MGAAAGYRDNRVELSDPPFCRDFSRPPEAGEEHIDGRNDVIRPIPAFDVSPDHSPFDPQFNRLLDKYDSAGHALAPDTSTRQGIGASGAIGFKSRLTSDNSIQNARYRSPLWLTTSETCGRNVGDRAPDSRRSGTLPTPAEC